MEKFIVKVRVSKTGQKVITIPRECNVKKGDYVEVVLLK